MLLAICAGAQAQADALVPVVRPVGPALEVRPSFAFDKKTRRSVSGIACAPNARGQRCLVAFDEGTKAQFANLGSAHVEPIGEPVELVRGGGELDAESVTLANGHFYVAGSHSVKRTSCKRNEASRQLIRFKAGAPGGTAPSVAVSDFKRTARLWDLMLADPYLGVHADGCLGDGSGGERAQRRRRPGVDIEGIAMLGDRLYVGFRGPTENGKTPVFSVDAHALFEGGDAKPRLEWVVLGKHAGIRDMAAARDSILLLVGPDDQDVKRDDRWRVAEWRPGTVAPRMLAALDVRRSDVQGACYEALKPEALAILEESSRVFRVLVLSDGVCDGGPLIFELMR